MKLFGLITILLTLSSLSYAQVRNGVLGGLTGEIRTNDNAPLPDVKLLIVADSAIVGGFCCTDENGRYKIKQVPSGIFDIRFEAPPACNNCKPFYVTKTIKGFTIYANRYSVLNATLEEDTALAKTPVKVMPNHFYHYNRK